MAQALLLRAYSLVKASEYHSQTEERLREAIFSLFAFSALIYAIGLLMLTIRAFPNVEILYFNEATPRVGDWFGFAALMSVYIFVYWLTSFSLGKFGGLETFEKEYLARKDRGHPYSSAATLVFFYAVPAVIIFGLIVEGNPTGK